VIIYLYELLWGRVYDSVERNLVLSFLLLSLNLFSLVCYIPGAGKKLIVAQPRRQLETFGKNVRCAQHRSSLN
jgi:hypothetical protein